MQRESANGRSSVTTKEQILIREIKNVGTDRAGADEGYGLYDVNADYEPIFDKSYLAECLELYKKYFPESGIANDNLCKTAKSEGAFAKLKSKIVPKKKDTTSDSEVINILRKFDAFVDEHKMMSMRWLTERSACLVRQVETYIWIITMWYVRICGSILREKYSYSVYVHAALRVSEWLQQ